ncbi:MAG: DUF1566 domain-containing protein, partial [Candidatus Electrothrix sp. ATG1]|nr:DUF1566 domain-containing protein [Candidatus Electrothrix sp. ATG1]
GYNGHADQGGDTCFGYESGNPPTYCNTQNYVQRVNAEGWCGASDWRMPTRKELESLVVYNHNNPSIDINYFPNAVNSYVWSGSPHAYYTPQAWSVFFGNGLSSFFQYRSYSHAIRLVRSGL